MIMFIYISMAKIRHHLEDSDDDFGRDLVFPEVVSVPHSCIICLVELAIGRIFSFS